MISTSFEKALGYALFSLTFLELLEIFVPWENYCGVYFSLYYTYAQNKDLGYEDSNYQTYPQIRDNLCSDFQEIIERACSEFCSNVQKFEDGGSVMLSGNLACIMLNFIFGLLFVCKGRVRGLAFEIICWSATFLKIFLGIAYFQIIEIQKISYTWQPDFDVYLSSGIYLYFLNLMLSIGISYVAYNGLEGKKTEDIEKLVIN